MILHIAERGQWQLAQAAGLYRGNTLESEGFIHCSRPDQIVRVANSLYRGRQDLILLCIDPTRVRAEIRNEALLTDESFPHIYGPLNTDAVDLVLDFAPAQDGSFMFPEELARWAQKGA